MTTSHLALLTSSGQEQSKMAAQTKPVDSEGDTEQQRLGLLGGGRASGGPRRACALGRRACETRTSRIVSVDHSSPLRVH